MRAPVNRHGYNIDSTGKVRVPSPTWSEKARAELEKVGTKKRKSLSKHTPQRKRAVMDSGDEEVIDSSKRNGDENDDWLHGSG